MTIIYLAEVFARELSRAVHVLKLLQERCSRNARREVISAALESLEAQRYGYLRRVNPLPASPLLFSGACGFPVRSRYLRRVNPLPASPLRACRDPHLVCSLRPPS